LRQLSNQSNRADAQQEQLATALRESRVRVNALRLTWKGPLEALS